MPTLRNRRAIASESCEPALHRSTSVSTSDVVVRRARYDYALGCSQAYKLDRPRSLVPTRFRA